MDTHLSEEDQLIIACKKKEIWAMRRLYELYASAMLGICVRYVSDVETAKDVVQEGFIKVFDKIGHFRREGSFEGWMRKIFVNTALESLRKNRLFSTVAIEEYSEIVSNTEFSGIEKLSVDEIARCIQELPPMLRATFNLYAIEGYSHAEIARILHIKEATSRSHFFRARQILQTKLQNRYK